MEIEVANGYVPKIGPNGRLYFHLEKKPHLIYSIEALVLLGKVKIHHG